MSVLAAGDALRILAGQKPFNFINPHVWRAAQARRASLKAAPTR